MTLLVYANSTRLIEAGDFVSMDGMLATVEQIIPAMSSESYDFDCVETGGILLLTKDYGRMLVRYDGPKEWILRERLEG